VVQIMRDALVQVTQLAQAETMRRIRNTCRQFMTNDQREISADEQVRWFQSILGSEVVLPFLYQPPHLAVALGYGLLRRIEDRWWVSGGLLPEHRGRGHGRALFGTLAARVHGFGQTCWLEVLEGNAVARRTYESLGFVKESASADESTFVMKSVKP